MLKSHLGRNRVATKSYDYEGKREEEVDTIHPSPYTPGAADAIAWPFIAQSGITIQRLTNPK